MLGPMGPREDEENRRRSEAMANAVRPLGGPVEPEAGPDEDVEDDGDS
jgi:hypothetical protein